MKKRGRILLIEILISLVLISSAYAVSVTYTYPGLTNINAIVYQNNQKVTSFCNPSCSSGSGNSIIINYPTQATDYNTYHYKQDYLPLLKNSNSGGDIYGIIKQPSCQAVANIVVPSSAQINTNFDVQLSFNKIFTDLDTSFVPTELEDYYKTSANVILYIDGVSSETKSIQILNTGDSIVFTKQLATEGFHKIKIKTLVTDDQCQIKQGWTSLEYSIEIKASTTTEIKTPTEECSQTTPQCPPNAIEKCPTGHPRCSCSTLGGTICKENENCLTTPTLIHEDAGICCKSQCIPKIEKCTTEGPQLCDPDEFGCARVRTCQNEVWIPCTKIDSLCTGTQDDCSDGTPSGRCSSENPGKICINKELQVQYDLCGEETTNQTCQELWDCLTWDIYNDKKKCNQWIDMHNCGTKNNPPADQYVSLNYESPYAYYERTGEYQEGSFSGGSLSAIGNALPSNNEKENIISSILNKFVGIPRDFRVKVGFELPILMLIIAIVIGSFFVYAFTHKHPKIIKEEKKEPKKTKTSPVKVNDLLLSVIESLKGDERRVVDILVEQEGITVEELRKKLGLTKTKMDIALQKLERRQIIKERKDYDSGLFFNDWMK